MRNQKTIKKTAVFEGIGLHCGIFCHVKLHPAPINHGVVIKRIDKDAIIKVRLDSIFDTQYSTTIGNNDVNIQTIEHLLACLSAFNIDNILIESDRQEIPILDGSCLGLVEIINNAGIIEQDCPMKFLRILKPLTHNYNGSSVKIEPSESRRISYRIDYKGHFIGEQELSIDINQESFIDHIAPARTFGFLKDVDYLKSIGRALGGSMDNAVVFSDTGVLNDSGLRFPNECVRHKILDLIGDLSLIAMPIMGHITADKSGHTLNIQFLKELLKNSDRFEIVTG
jgi:UDP-3-O-[3-hydroxymyristoyl] N-acetylglucosamine deacetylase